MEVKKLNDTIYQMDYILCCLTAYRGIIETGRDCNGCAAAKGCEYAPKPGEQVRYNCPHYVEPKTEQNDSITCTNDSEKPNTSPDHIAEADKMEPFTRDHENDKDCIDRAEAMTELMAIARRCTLSSEAHGEGRVLYSSYYIDDGEAMDVLRRLSSAQPKSRPGKWLKDFKNGLMYKCSDCGSRFRAPWLFCPGCGADMRGDKHE